MAVGRALWTTLGLRTFVSRRGRIPNILFGSIIGIGLSLIPLVVVLVLLAALILFSSASSRLTSSCFELTAEPM